MGMVMSSGYREWKEPHLHPNRLEPPTFDANYGFPNGRKEREPTLTYEEMVAYKIPEEFRDYCAHHYAELQKCFRKHMPFGYRCSHEKHHWDDCQFDEFVIRMKEYEREKRLLQRAARKKINSPTDTETLED
ncbi:NADH dehydrogenase [ubiquinone] 1 beta subcomplex subunit 7-like [Ylistrum balloti]|uniref:NADH dehydrogenase [ubiquinone] 1 beta subcomplex subunit 7-like n=1 Tax=Ylistrum balloti TaxID=509963 RepID=UPI002905EDEC|nr:NADH dehydrogenase [ubiquinone] 1 beta subcomplex subunit 7-like [Ylistrum balloti]